MQFIPVYIYSTRVISKCNLRNVLWRLNQFLTNSLRMDIFEEKSIEDVLMYLTATMLSTTILYILIMLDFHRFLFSTLSIPSSFRFATFKIPEV